MLSSWSQRQAKESAWARRLGPWLPFLEETMTPSRSLQPPRPFLLPAPAACTLPFHPTRQWHPMLSASLPVLAPPLPLAWRNCFFVFARSPLLSPLSHSTDCCSLSLACLFHLPTLPLLYRPHQPAQNATSTAGAHVPGRQAQHKAAAPLLPIFPPALYTPSLLP